MNGRERKGYALIRGGRVVRPEYISVSRPSRFGEILPRNLARMAGDEAEGCAGGWQNGKSEAEVQVS